MSNTHSTPITELEAVEEQKIEILQNNGYSCFEDLQDADSDEVSKVPTISPDETTQILQEVRAEKTGNGKLSIREGLATDLGYSYEFGNPPPIDELIEFGRDTTLEASVTPIEFVKQAPGKPLRVTNNWDSQNSEKAFPVLKDIDHPLVPSMDMAVQPEFYDLETDTPIDKSIRNALSKGKPILLEGPHGCGKNYMLSWIFYQRNRPCVSIDLNEGMRAKDLIGTMYPQEDGSIEFEEKFLPMCAKNGIAIILNEFRTVSSDIQTAIHQLMEADRLTIAESGESIEPHPAFRIIATTNPNTREYDAAGSVDRATLSRFRIIPCSFLPKEAEIDLLDRKFNRKDELIPKEIIRAFVEVAAETRDNRSYPTISTRELEDALEWAYDDNHPRGALKMTVETRAHRSHNIQSLKQDYIDDMVPTRLR